MKKDTVESGNRNSIAKITVKGSGSADSNIHAQPEGEDMTSSGASNRLKNAKKDFEERPENANVKATYVTMESGLIYGKNEYYDRCVIIIRFPNGEERRIVSAGVKFDKDVVEEVKAMDGGRGFEKRRAADLLVERGKVKDVQDPQNELTAGEFPRDLQIGESLELAFLRPNKF